MTTEYVFDLEREGATQEMKITYGADIWEVDPTIFDKDLEVKIRIDDRVAVGKIDMLRGRKDLLQQSYLEWAGLTYKDNDGKPHTKPHATNWPRILDETFKRVHELFQHLYAKGYSFQDFALWHRDYRLPMSYKGFFVNLLAVRIILATKFYIVPAGIEKDPTFIGV